MSVDPVQLNPELRTIREAWNSGRLLIGFCRACDEPHYYPRSCCPFCMSSETETREASGEGEVYSFSIGQRDGKVHIMAYVRLAEGPVMMSNIVDTPPDEVMIGLPVRLTMREVDNQPSPMFVSAC